MALRGGHAATLLLLFLGVVSVYGAVFHVTITSDEGAAVVGSLRWALTEANGRVGLDEVRCDQKSSPSSHERVST